MSMSMIVIAAALAASAAAPAPAANPGKTYANELSFFREKNYSGADYPVRRANSEIVLDFNVGSISLNPGDTWEVCAMTHFRNCITLTESVPDASKIGITGQMGSARLLKKK
jgi:hypothetical protein